MKIKEMKKRMKIMRIRSLKVIAEIAVEVKKMRIMMLKKMEMTLAKLVKNEVEAKVVEAKMMMNKIQNKKSKNKKIPKKRQ